MTYEDKQMPKKPVKKIEVYTKYDDVGAICGADILLHIRCPKCGEWVDMADHGCYVFCYQCGQAIDISEVN